MLEVTSPTGANFWDKPSIASTKLATIPFRERLVVVGSPKRDFEMVSFRGHVGYVARPFVRVVDTGAISAVPFAGKGTYKSTGDSVAIRSEPKISAQPYPPNGYPAIGNGSNVVGWLNAGDIVEATGEVQDRFAKVGGSKGVGWVSTSYLEPATGADIAARGAPPAFIAQQQPSPPADIELEKGEGEEKTELAEEGLTKNKLVLAGGLLLLAIVIYFVAK